VAGLDVTFEFRILGPFEVSDEGRPLDVGAGKQQALLALLLLRAGEVVSTDRLIDELWDERPPASATNSVHIYVSQLRKMLGNGLLQTRGRGYVLELEPEQLDLNRFERLLGEGRAFLGAGEAERAADALRAALGLWRGPALSDFASEPFAQSEIARLEELHLAALEERIESDLLLGRHADLVPELEALVREHPLRERLSAQLMLALYRSGRQSEALDAYQRSRRMLAEDLGLDPGRGLQELQRAILSQDAHLDPPARAAVRVGRSRRRSGALIAVGAALLLATAAAVMVIELTGDDGPGLASVSANSLAAIDPGSNRLAAEIPVGNGPTSVAAGEGALWVTNADGTVSRIDAVKKVVVDTIGVGSNPRGITIGNGFVWVTNSLGSSVSRIDPATDTVVQTVPVGNGPDGIVYAAESIWVANTGDDTITRIDADSGRPIRTLPIAATDIAFGSGTLWASQRTANRVVRIDPSTEKVVHAIRTGNGPAGIAFGAGAAWVTNSLDGTVSRIDPATNSVRATVPTGEGTRAVAVEPDGGVWVSNEFEGTVARIDPRTNLLGRRITVGNRPQGVTTTADSVLVSVRQSSGEHRGGTLRVRTNRRADSIDTAVAYDATSWWILRMTSDGLVAFRQAGGLPGTQLVPDLARSLPTPTDEGKTYRFQLRRGIRYSDGTAVKASDFGRAIERVFKLQSGGAGYYAGIVGGARCFRTPTSCDLSAGIVADEPATVTFHLVAPDPEFLHKLALPFASVVPGTTPLHNTGRPLPATGPYVIATYRSKRQLRLVRNVHFHEWSQAAQPDGYPDEIVVENGRAPDEAVGDVVAGRADVFSTSHSLTPISEKQLAVLRTQHASHVHSNPRPATVALFLNTRVPPFDRLDVRRALNFAADRAEAVGAAGGADNAQATCQILPPNFPGYRPYCPYTAGSARTSSWKGPDRAKARALVAASGTYGMKVTVWSWADFPEIGTYAVKLLKSLGYRVSIKVRPQRTYWPSVFDPRTKAQIGTVAWATDYPTPAGFFNPVLTCPSFLGNANPAQFCEPRIDRQIADTLGEQSTNPDAARGLWERVDRQTVDLAPWVPLVTPKTVDVLSARVGNYQYGIHLGMLVDQLWVR